MGGGGVSSKSYLLPSFIFHYFAIRSAKVRTLAKALSPSYLRFGGTDADTLLFDDELAQDKSQTYKENLMQGNDQVILYEPRHEKMCLRESPTRPDTNWPAQLQRLARVLKFRL